MAEKIDSRGIVEFLENTHTRILQKNEEFNDVLTNLRYEGRLFAGKNLKQAWEVLSFFEDELIPHVKLEEEILFPFLNSHLPKLESLIHLLRSEHQDFERNLGSFKFQLQELSNEKEESRRGKIIEKIVETGTYLIYLLRHHLQVENEGIYRAIDRELRADERKVLSRQIQNGRRLR